MIKKCRAISALTILLMIIFLIQPIAQVTVVEANPYSFPPWSPRSGFSLTPNVQISIEYNIENYLPQIDSFSFTLDNKPNSTLSFRISEVNMTVYSRDSPVRYVEGTKYTVSEPLENLANGNHTIIVYAYFSDGIVKSILNSLVTVDTTSQPIVILISPLNQTTYNSTEVPLVYTTNSKVLWSYYRLDSINSSDLKNFNGTITLPNLSEGQHELNVVVTTNISATNPTYRDIYQTIHHTVIFYIDSVAPKITDLSVNSTDSSDLLLNYAVDENTSWVGYSLDNQANITINGNAVLRDLSNGVHNVTVYAKDSNGNIGVSETISFPVGLFPLMVVVALIATIAIVVVPVTSVILYKRRKKVSDSHD
jgi:hypothetical protein